MAELQFFGAAQTVTGSMHYLRLDDRTIFALDCGLYQGRRKEANERNRTFPIEAKQLSGVLLSHAHIDHSGNIPGLMRDGFEGQIHTTPATCDLCEVMLADSAHIHEEDADYWNRRRAKSKDEEIEPLYTMADAEASFSHFARVKYNESLEFAPGARATWIEAGHILGSACVLVELDGTRILYSGDMGRFDLPILRDPTNPLPEADYLITECTYADREHDNPTDMKGKLVRIIDETRERGGKVIIPAFSVGRTQTLTYYLQQAVAEGMMEPLPIFVDSPLSTRATKVFRAHPECYDAEARAFWHEEGDVFGRGLVRYVTPVEESKRLNELDEPCVIIASSGMCEAGRILHHLKNNVTDPRNTVVIVGFMAQHTLGRRLVQRKREIKIFGRMYRLKARVEILNGFSAHADVHEFKRLYAPLAPKLKAAFCVHGEGSQLEGMETILKELGCENVYQPEPGFRFKL